jgi:hypothetical protein
MATSKKQAACSQLNTMVSDATSSQKYSVPHVATRRMPIGTTKHCWQQPVGHKPVLKVCQLPAESCHAVHPSLANQSRQLRHAILR